MGANRFVYVIYGQHDLLKRELFAFLHKLSLDPLDCQSAASLVQKASPLRSEVVANGLQMAQVILVMHLANDEQETDATEIAEARSSFASEVALASTLPEKVLHLWFGMSAEEGVYRREKGSDALYLDNSINAREHFIQRLRALGCPINKQPNWYCTGNFFMKAEQK